METMVLQKNPFFILHADLTDDHAALQRKASEAVLLEDTGEAEKALSNLLHPQKRLEAELMWFPETEDTEIEKLEAFCRAGEQPSRPDKVSDSHDGTGSQPSFPALPDFQTESDLAMVNACRCILGAWPAEYSEGLFGIGLCLAGALRGLTVDGVIAELNRAREVSGFPEITNREMVGNHLMNLRESILGDFSNRMKKAKKGEAGKAASLLAEEYGRSDPLYEKNYYIQKMVETYMVTVSDQEKRQISEISERLKWSMKDSAMQALRDWDKLTGPRRKIKKAQGLTDEGSENLIRSLSEYVDEKLAKKKLAELLEAAKMLEVMLEVFWDVPEERLARHREVAERCGKLLKKR